jgi:3-oxoadipate enol-lactonase
MTSPAPSSTTTIEQLADQAAALIRQADLGSVHVVGVSLGGLVAQVLAATHPGLVDHLAVVDAVATYPEVLRQQWRDRQVSVRKGGMEPLVEPTLALWFTAGRLAQGGPEIDYVREAVLAGQAEGYARTCEALETVDLTALASRIAAPTLVVCGQDDAPPFTAAAPWLAETVPDGRLVWLEPARHAGVLEQPEQFVTALRDFLPAVPA